MDETYKMYLRGYTVARSMTPASTFSITSEGKNAEERAALALGVHDGKAERPLRTQAEVAKEVKRLLTEPA